MYSVYWKTYMYIHFFKFSATLSWWRTKHAVHLSSQRHVTQRWEIVLFWTHTFSLILHRQSLAKSSQDVQEGSKSNIHSCALLARQVHGRNICVGFADVMYYGPRIMQMLRAPAAQQGMLLLDPSVTKRFETKHFLSSIHRQRLASDNVTEEVTTTQKSHFSSVGTY
jgi:hypothetical protein